MFSYNQHCGFVITFPKISNNNTNFIGFISFIPQQVAEENIFLKFYIMTILLISFKVMFNGLHLLVLIENLCTCFYKS